VDPSHLRIEGYFAREAEHSADSLRQVLLQSGLDGAWLRVAEVTASQNGGAGLGLLCAEVTAFGSDRAAGDLATLPRPVVGFYGTIQDWVDLELIAHLARSQPKWSFVLLGQIMVPTDAVSGLSNVHLLGKRKHHELPAYCKGFDVGLIPYRIDERMPFVNPIKLREYLSAGLPVVSTAVPEVLRYPHWCSVGNSHEDVHLAIQRALQEDSPERRRERSLAMEGETWQARLAEIERVVEDVAARKPGKRRT